MHACGNLSTDVLPCLQELADYPTGCSDDNFQATLPPDSKLSMLLHSCLYSPQATADSKQRAVELTSACAMADSGAYRLLLSGLENTMWTGQSTSVQRTAAAGTVLICPNKSWSQYTCKHVGMQLHAAPACSSLRWCYLLNCRAYKLLQPLTPTPLYSYCQWCCQVGYVKCACCSMLLF